VPLAGEVEGPLNLGPVDRRHRDRGTAEPAQNVPVRGVLVRGVELLDDREQVAEQLFALYRNIGLCRNDRASECSLL
jgi:hypothetical protein